MKLLDLPSFHWVKDRSDVKILRHRDDQLDLWALRHEGTFGKYQDDQARDVFGDARYLLSFIAERNRFAKFVGVWEIHSRTALRNGNFRYSTTEQFGYDDLAARLIVEWGGGMRSWAQWLHLKGNKAIFELLPPKYVGDFPGLYNFTLTYADLVTMVSNPEANRDWHRMLSSVSGVYLIVDTSTGLQYVGSAYGVNGIWSRWSAYARRPHGGGARQDGCRLSHAAFG